MLAVEKENLLAAASREIALLRETELRYYIQHISDMQTMATLLAGFAFTALVQSDTLNLDLNAVLFREETGSVERPVNATSRDANVAGTTVSSPTYATVEDPLKYFSFLMHASELTSTVLCLGQMLHVITESLIARLLGSRLALRGPDGSIIRATRHLAKALASTTRTFFTGLQFFILSVVFYSLRGQHPAVAMAMVSILFVYWRGQGDLADKLSLEFHLEKSVTTSFADEEPKPRRPSFDATTQTGGNRGSYPTRRSALSDGRRQPGHVSFTSETTQGSSGSTLSSPSSPAGTSTGRISPTLSSFSAASLRAREKRLWRHLLAYLSPVGHKLNFLFDEVAKDFEGEGSVANSRHRNPQAATQHLIMRTEARQQSIERSSVPFTPGALLVDEGSGAISADGNDDDSPIITRELTHAWRGAKDWVRSGGMGPDLGLADEQKAAQRNRGSPVGPPPLTDMFKNLEV